jgi:hypothetical protein
MDTKAVVARFKAERQALAMMDHPNIDKMNRRTPMRVKLTIVGMVGLAALLCGAIGFGAARQPLRAISIRHVETLELGDGLEAMFQITNGGPRMYWVAAKSIEVREGGVWKPCFGFRGAFASPIVAPQSSVSSTFHVADLPTGSPLRLKVDAARELVGLESLWMRIEWRVRYWRSQTSLNPFDKGSHLFAKPTELVSEEFIQPQLPSEAGRLSRLGGPEINREH